MGEDYATKEESSMPMKYTGCEDANANKVGNKIAIQDMECIDKTQTTQEKKGAENRKETSARATLILNKQPSIKGENGSRSLAVYLRSVSTRVATTKNTMIVLTRWLALRLRYLMKCRELRTGIKMIILVTIVSEPRST